MKRTGYRRGWSLGSDCHEPDTQRQAALAVIDIFDRLRAMHKVLGNLSQLRRSRRRGLGRLRGCCGIFCQREQLRVRLPVALMQHGRDKWNLLDGLNYGLFVFSYSVRIHTLFAQQSLRREVEAFSSLVEQAELTAAYSTHLDFSEVGSTLTLPAYTYRYYTEYAL